MTVFPHDTIAHEPLTPREMDVLFLLIENKTNKEIAQKLTLAPSSVKWYVKQVYAKIGVNEREQVAGRATELGLVTTFSPAIQPHHNLPASISPFIGRQGQITQLHRMVTDPTCRLVTLTGPGGVGKTRLALKVAEMALHAFKHGAWLVDLSAVSKASQVESVAAAALGLNDVPGPMIREALRDFLSRKKLLLVLDNCEHLIDACARLADTLLRASPNLHILATSREALEIEGEIPFAVPSLTFPITRRIPEVESLSKFESILLFAQRARTILPDFAINQSNARDVVRICRRLDGIPLAIELAASRVKVLSVVQIADGLEKTFDLLTGNYRMAPSRHQTMRASLEWSAGLLEGQEKVLLRRLAAFSGGCTLAAVKSVAGVDPIRPGHVLDLLDGLVSKSLVVVERPENQEIRYRLLVMVHELASKMLFDAGEAYEIADRHLAFYAHLSELAEPNFKKSEEIFWQIQIERELENLWSAFHHCLSGGRIEDGLRIIGALPAFWNKNFSNQAYRLSSEVIKLARFRNDLAGTRLLARGLSGYASLLELENEWKKRHQVLTESLQIYEALGDIAAQGRTLTAIAMVSQGEQTRELLRRGLELSSCAGDLWSIALNCSVTVGCLGDELGIEKADALAEKAIKSFLEAGDPGLARMVLDRHSWKQWSRQEFRKGITMIENHLSVYRNRYPNYILIDLISDLMNMYLAMGELEDAQYYAEDAFQIRRSMNEYATWLGHFDLAKIAFWRGDMNKARPSMETTLRAFREMEIEDEVPLVLNYLGMMEVYAGYAEKGLEMFEQSQSFCRADNDNVSTFYLFTGIAFSLLKEFERAQKDLRFGLKRIVELMDEPYQPDQKGVALMPLFEDALAIAALGLGDPRLAARLFGAAYHLRLTFGMKVLPVYQQDRESALQATREALSEKEFQREWNLYTNTGWRATVDLALGIGSI